MFDKIIQEDIRCMSVMTKSKINNYLGFVNEVYKDNGGISGQRAPLKTKTAITIRKRMVEDIGKGAVLPPVVIGVHVNKEEWDRFLEVDNHEELLKLVGAPHLGRVSIIDGMQRTTAIIDAAETEPRVFDRDIRVEYWVSDSLNNLIYRMLVLNTGQVPWDMSRQLKTIYNPLMSIILDKLDATVEVFDGDKETRRRTRSGQYKIENLIQLLLNFSSGKYEIELKDKIAEDFARLDLIESSSHEVFLDYFVETIILMTLLDEAFSKCVGVDTQPGEQKPRYDSGSSIFKGFPAQVGFCVAASNYLFDEPGFEVDWELANTRFEEFKNNMLVFIERINKMTQEELYAFLELQIIDELMSVKKSQVGRFERGFFTEAFAVLITKSERLKNMAPCWRKA
ncbi:hypothetical protein [Aeromonas hydrophila]|uniref:hypothetical protein n=1 Tax=Aeromonas hydrophila TaxID=644 RepID=UPI001F36DEE6|nr:hypothetical protein [Aeromonas hydrophila]BDC80818.1 hypothetical protein NUITMVA1_07610 [Aeromonas hydrophila]